MHLDAIYEQLSLLLSLLLAERRVTVPKRIYYNMCKSWALIRELSIQVPFSPFPSPFSHN